MTTLLHRAATAAGLAAVTFAAAVAMPGPSTAGGDVPQPDNVARIELLPGWATERGTHMAGLRIRLAPGWKTYWRAPGDTGIPPSLDWSGSRNLAAAELLWPTPHVFHQNGVTAIGYKGEVILPIELTPVGPGPIRARAQLEIGVCQDVCMPMTIELSADLKDGALPDPRIRAAMDDRPVEAGAARVSAVRCELEEIADGMRVTARLQMPRLGPDEVAVFELSDREVWISAADTSRDGITLIATAEMVPPAAAPFPVAASDIRITVLDGAGRGVDIRGCAG